MRETSDMVRVLPTENTKDTKIKMHMKSESIEPQNTQNAQKYIMVQERDKKKSLCVFSRCLRLKKPQKTQKNAKKIRVLRVIR